MKPALLALVTLLAVSLLPGLGHGMQARDFEEEIRRLERGEQPRLGIPDARYRVAVFTYEDPDGTGLGNALAALMSQEILLRSQVGSIGVLRYEGGLSPTASESLSYFDKVEKVTKAQEVILAVWGMVRRDGDRVLVDTYLQLPQQVLRQTFRWKLILPAQMGGGELWAQLRPTRVLVQHYEISTGAVTALREAALRLDELRTEPRDSASVVDTLPVGSTYWFDVPEGEWVKVHAAGGRSGWVRSSRHCTGECAPLLDAGRFVAGLLRFMKDRTIPEAAGTLTPDARAIRDQLYALEALDQGSAEAVQGRSLDLATRWVKPEAADRGLVPPGGAAFANVQALAKIAIGLKLAARKRRQEGENTRSSRLYEGLVLDRGKVRAIAFDLAQHSLVDPGNIDVLHNLAVLFSYSGDQERARLAQTLEMEAGGER